MPVVRYLECFEILADRFVGRVRLTLTLEELQKLFDVAAENPMYDCWQVKPEHVEYLQVSTGQLIDLARFVYFVSAEQA